MAYRSSFSEAFRWKIRSRLDNRIARIIFVFEEGTMILLHGFIKKAKRHQKMI
ncbi:MAG: type II toxin-antitoxin system RelE/ParE family toxin [Candidatus Dependentiae bacterium]